MITADWLALFAVLICLLLSFFFSGSETALTASSRAAMLRLRKERQRACGHRQPADAEARAADRRSLIGNNVATIAASSLATGVLLAWSARSA